MANHGGRGNEDLRLTEELMGKTGPATSKSSNALRRSQYLVGPPEANRRSELERTLREASKISICGIASRSVVLAMSTVAAEVRKSEKDFPWDSLHYVTPTPSMILTGRSGVGLGPVVRDWQAAVDTIRNCARQQARAVPAAAARRSKALQLLGMRHYFLEMLMHVTVRSTGRKEFWLTIGAGHQSNDLPLLVVEETDDNYPILDDMHSRLIEGCEELAIRQVRCDLIEASDVNGPPPPGGRHDEKTPYLVVHGLEPYGTGGQARPACMPVAAVMIRANTNRGPVVMLRQRNEFSDTDSFGKYSLITSRLLEEDLATALGVPVFADRHVDAATDAMWQATRTDGPLGVPVKAFIRAAQRELFICCGLDAPESRFQFHGYQVVSTADGSQLGFAVFELVLNRHEPFDELVAAEDWDREENLLVVSQSDLYTEAYTDRLNRLLTQREGWFRTTILARPIAASH
ncbi:hypothetical protein AB0N38_03115 [Micromonospora aurantiaca]|uniref:hypothetical protein n=1 Tax=Micromonospora TaxID=1873 RepID=UPI0008292E95|nr:MULTISPECIES: hypothetical protein [Micromonospora]OHX05211.1 hypothetical protein BFV98_20615 [Micromonospora sp. WMMB235]RNI00683.1 hypothetical protein EEZ25_18745 [Micromonospora aurantiaca]SCL40229.1 hypothetical protein GA0070615_4350 [Micromonospora aurantiaca]